MKSLKKRQATAIISELFKVLRHDPDAAISVEEAGRRMVEIYRLLTDEMPQSPGIEEVFDADEELAVEWATPIERRPDELFYVKPGFGGEPDILIKGDQNGTSQKEIQSPQDQDCQKALPEKGEGEYQGKQ